MENRRLQKFIQFGDLLFPINPVFGGNLTSLHHLDQQCASLLPLVQFAPVPFQPTALMEPQSLDRVLSNRREPMDVAIEGNVPVQIMVAPLLTRIKPANALRLLFRCRPRIAFVLIAFAARPVKIGTVSYTHLTLPTNREV